MTTLLLLTIKNDRNYLIIIIGVYSSCSMYYSMTNMTFVNFTVICGFFILIYIYEKNSFNDRGI